MVDEFEPRDVVIACYNLLMALCVKRIEARPDDPLADNWRTNLTDLRQTAEELPLNILQEEADTLIESLSAQFRAGITAMRKAHEH